MTPWLKSIDPRRVPLFAAAVLALVAAALALYVVLPQDKARRAALAEKTALAPSTATAAALKSERAALEATVRGLVTASSSGEPLSRQALEGATIEHLQDIARRRDVELVALAPRAGAEIGTLEETTYEVELVGAYADTVKLLRDLREELEPLVVRDLTLTPRDDTRDPAVRARLVAATFGERR